MSAKIAVISSITWLIGWMRPVSVGRVAHRQRDVDASRRRAALRARLPSAPRGARSSASLTLSLSALMAAPALLRSSGDIAPSVSSRAETEPFLPSAATRTASSAASSPRRRWRQGFRSRACSDRTWRHHGWWESGLLPRARRLVEESAGAATGRIRERPASLRAFCKGLTGVRSDHAAFGSAPLAFSTRALKAAGSWIAMSDSTLRSTSMPALPGRR